MCNIQHGLQSTELGDYCSEMRFLFIQFSIFPWEPLQRYSKHFISLCLFCVASSSPQTRFFPISSPEEFCTCFYFPTCLHSQWNHWAPWSPALLLWDSLITPPTNPNAGPSASLTEESRHKRPIKGQGDFLNRHRGCEDGDGLIIMEWPWVTVMELGEEGRSQHQGHSSEWVSS